MPTDSAPDLRCAYITRVQLTDGALRLSVNGARRLSLLLSGDVTFENAKVAGFDPRGSEPELKAGMRVVSQQSRPGGTVLDAVRQPGPGEVDELRFTITHDAVASTLRPAPGATLRSWTGFYPLPRDLAD